MKKLILILSLLCIRQTNAQNYVLIPDANFVNYLYTLMPTAMSGNFLNITSPLVIAVTQTMNVSGHSISNLSGIQYFISLQALYCNNNSLSSLPALPNSLTLLNCSYNSITTLPALPNSLISLYCNNNYFLTSLPALPNSLQTLACGDNSLTTLPALPNSLQNLTCYNNGLTSLPALPNSLTILICDNNHLTTLPALPNSLTSLACNNNSLTTLPALPNSLQSLDCSFNKIVCFSVFSTSLTTCNISSNPYTCLPNYVLPAMNAYTTTPLCALGNTNGCTVVAGIKQLNANNNDISIYPNPANGEFIVEAISTEKQMMQLFDLNGKLVISENINGKATIDVSNLNTGVYNLTLKRDEGVLNKKLVIVK